MLRGDVPYRDFFEFIAPGTLFLVRACLSLFGEDTTATRVVLLVVYLLSAGLLFHLARRLTNSALVALLAPLYLVVVAKQSLWWAVEHHALSNFGVLLAAALLVVGIDRPRRWVGLALGLVSGATLVITQHVGVLLCSVVAICWAGVLPRRGGGSSRERCLELLAGVALPVLGVLVYLVAHGALLDAIDCTIRWPLTGYRSFHAEPYFGAGWSEIDALWATRGTRALRKIVHLLLIGIGPLVALAIALARIAFEKPARDPARAIVWACAGAALLSVAAQPSAWAVSQSSALSFVVLLDLLLPRGPLQKRHALSIALLIALGFDLAGQLQEQAKSIAREQAHAATVATAFGEFVHPDPTEAADLARVLELVAKESSPADRILVYYWSPQLYLASGRLPAIRFSGLLPGYNSEAQLGSVQAAIHARTPTLVIRDRTVETMIAEGDRRFTRLSTATPFRGEIDRWVEEGYRPVLELERLTVFGAR